MKKLLYVIPIFLILFSGCNKKEVEKLKMENQQLVMETNAKDSVINDFFGSFDQIEGNLSEIKTREGIISESTSKSNELKQDARQRINDDIQVINTLMDKNKQAIAAIKSKLKNSNFKISKLEEMLARYEKQFLEKDVEIEQLKQQLLKLNFTVENLNATVDTLKGINVEKDQMISQKVSEMNTAWYAMGTTKELKENKVISKSGGFIGIGRSEKVQQDFNTEYFKKIDITMITSININAKKAKLLTSHPSSSYTLEGTDKMVEKLVITNPKEFWKASKYLVIVID